MSIESSADFRAAALDYHAHSPAGKLAVTATKPLLTQRDLSLAYSPGVAAPCEETRAARSTAPAVPPARFETTCVPSGRRLSRHAVVFTVNCRPVRGTRGDYRVKMRHGVSEIAEGQRHTLGIIFHDAS